MLSILDVSQLSLLQHFRQFTQTQDAWSVFEVTFYLPLCLAIFLFHVFRMIMDYRICKRRGKGEKPLVKKPMYVINAIAMSIPYVHVWWLIIAVIVMTWDYMFDPR